MPLLHELSVKYWQQMAVKHHGTLSQLIDTVEKKEGKWLPHPDQIAEPYKKAGGGGGGELKRKHVGGEFIMILDSCLDYEGCSSQRLFSLACCCHTLEQTRTWEEIGHMLQAHGRETTGYFYAAFNPSMALGVLHKQTVLLWVRCGV